MLKLLKPKHLAIIQLCHKPYGFLGTLEVETCEPLCRTFDSLITPQFYQAEVVSRKYVSRYPAAYIEVSPNLAKHIWYIYA